MNDISVFSNDTGLISWKDKKDRTFVLSNEAALFKGGAALKELKDVALQVAGNKAANGKYRAAADILAVAFPKEHKAFMGFIACEPWANASKMALFIEKCEGAIPGKNGWTAKQASARLLMAAMRQAIPAFKRESLETIEA